MILKFFYFSSLTCSQIWLIPLVDDCKCGYVTKLKKEKEKEKEKASCVHSAVVSRPDSQLVLMEYP